MNIAAYLLNLPIVFFEIYCGFMHDQLELIRPKGPPLF